MALIARAGSKTAEQALMAQEAGERAQAAKDRLARLARGKSIPGGLGNRLTFAPRSRRRASRSAA